MANWFQNPRLPQIPGVASIFLSHRHADRNPSVRIFEHLLSRGVPAYLDEIDPTLERDPERLTEHLRARLALCTHLMAVISEKTQGSWWVPFEIGLATEREYSIATYLLEEVQTPDYLKGWPYLRNPADLDVYIEEIRRGSAYRSKSYFDQPIQERAQDAQDFHRRLKRRLGQ